MTLAVRYRVSMPRPHSHLFEVEATFPAVAGTLHAVLPVWTPGSYMVREYARHIQDPSAHDASGRALAVKRTDKRTLSVESFGAPITLRYRVYANELSVRTSHLDGTHGYFNGATLFVYTEATRHLSHEVQVLAPAGWRVFTALPVREGCHIAASYDVLVDSPFEVGPHESHRFLVRGVPHEVVVWGDRIPDIYRLEEDLARICEEQARLFGGLPFERYLFLVYLTDKGRGGLEHADSTALLFPRAGLQSAKGWEDFLTLAAHEYLHLWNIKRVKPRAFVPFDYGQENYTSLLWAFEGATSYYDNVMVRRAGLMTPARYLTRLGETLTALHGTPGRRLQSLADSSLLTWVKQYRPDESSPNSAISYYVKGEIVAALLDLEVRRATADARSLDDVMRLLWQRHGDGSGVPEDGFELAAREVSGADLTPFFERSVRSVEELDYSAFHHVGLEVSFRPRESAADKGGTPSRTRVGEGRPRGWMGLALKSGGTVAGVVDGSPAMEAGLYVEDELIAVDGFKQEGASLVARCEERGPGETVRVSLFRRDRLLELPVTLGLRPADAVYLSRVEHPSEQQKAAYAAWLGASWDEPTG